MYQIVKCFHADHGVPADLLNFAVATLTPPSDGTVFKGTVVIPDDAPDLTSNLYGPSEGDAPVQGVVMVRDPDDEWRGATPFVQMPPRPSRKLTVVGICNPGGEVILFTAYGGALAERVPSDPSIRDNPEEVAKAKAFWAVHALSIAAKK